MDRQRGGISTTYAIPGWQTNVNMTANQGSTTHSQYSGRGHDGGQCCMSGGDGAGTTLGGTSCAAPLWAGFMALVNQQSAASGRPPVGFINPANLRDRRGTNYAATFHDITTGNK